MNDTVKDTFRKKISKLRKYIFALIHNFMLMIKEKSQISFQIDT